MIERALQDGAAEFRITVLEAPQPARVVLFAVGGGGNPERHVPLLVHLAAHDCTVVAPHFERLKSPMVTDEELLLRTRRLKLALDSVARPAALSVGVGHSIGAAALIALAGGQVWMSRDKRLSIARDERLDRLALLSPATGFFQAPGALDGVRTPILAWVGSQDAMTPPAHAEFLETALSPRVPVEVRVVQDAGHFSFMDTLPPGVVDMLPDRESVLANIAADCVRFITGRGEPQG